MSKPLLVAIALALVGGGWILGSSLRSAEGVSPGGGDAAAVATGTDVEARMAALEEKMQRLAVSIDRLAARGAAPPSAGGSNEGPVGPEPFDHEAAKARREQTQRDYAKRFAEDRVDPTWSVAAKTDLLAKAAGDHVLANAPAMPDKWNVECRSRMCQMSFDFSDPGAATDWTDAYMADMGNSLASVWTSEVRNPDGTTTVVMYGFR
jgi:hypothetical protein